MDASFIRAASTSLLHDAVDPMVGASSPLQRAHSMRTRRRLSPPGRYSKQHTRRSTALTSSTSSTSSSSSTTSSTSERLSTYRPYQQFRGPVYYGWLWKRGSSFKTWKKRFFLLHGCTLTYYTQCCVISSDQFGTRCLDLPTKGGLRVASAALSDLTEFGIVVTSSSGRLLYLQAGDQEARLQWLQVLQQSTTMQPSIHSKMLTDSRTISTGSDSEPHPVRYTSGSDFGYSLASANDLVGYQISLSTLDDSDGEERGIQRSGVAVCAQRGWLHVRGSIFPNWRKRYFVFMNGQLTIMSTCRDVQENDKTYEVIAANLWSGREYGMVVRLSNGKELCLCAESVEQVEQWIDAFKSCL